MFAQDTTDLEQKKLSDLKCYPGEHSKRTSCHSRRLMIQLFEMTLPKAMGGCAHEEPKAYFCEGGSATCPLGG